MSQPNPTISIGLPVYNGERYLTATINSILAQSYTDFELIIADNASTDSTAELCAAFAASDARVRYVRHEQNLGAARNYNHCFAMARGQYFKWAAADDLIAPSYLERCVAVLDTMPEVVLCYPRTTLIDENDAPLQVLEDRFNLRAMRPSERFATFLRAARGWMNPVFGLMRADVLRTTGLIGSFPSSDMTLVGELALHGEFFEIPEPLFFRREHPKMSVRANPSFKERMRWFDTSYRGGVQLTRWRWLAEYLGAIRRAPIGWREQMRCYLQMRWWLRKTRRELAEDLLSAAQEFARPAVLRVRGQEG